MSGTDQDLGSHRSSGAASANAPSRRWRALLLASLALNLMFAGLAAGTAWTWKRHHTSPAAGRAATDFALQSFIASLPKDRARELRRVIRQNGRPNILPLMSAVREARRGAAGVLAADTFSREELVAAFSAIDQAEAASKAAIRGVIVAAAGQMTAEERRALAARWKARRPHLFEDPPERPARSVKKKDKAASGVQ